MPSDGSIRVAVRPHCWCGAEQGGHGTMSLRWLSSFQLGSLRLQLLEASRLRTTDDSFSTYPAASASPPASAAGFTSIPSSEKSGTPSTDRPFTMGDPRESSSYRVTPRIRYNTVGGVNGPLVIVDNVSTLPTPFLHMRPSDPSARSNSPDTMRSLPSLSRMEPSVPARSWRLEVGAPRLMLVGLPFANRRDTAQGAERSCR